MRCNFSRFLCIYMTILFSIVYRLHRASKIGHSRAIYRHCSVSSAIGGFLGQLVQHRWKSQETAVRGLGQLGFACSAGVSGGDFLFAQRRCFWQLPDLPLSRSWRHTLELLLRGECAGSLSRNARPHSIDSLVWFRSLWIDRNGWLLSF